MNNPKDISLTISIVSHGQSKLIVPLLKNLIKFKKSFEKIFITINTCYTAHFKKKSF